MVYTEKRFTLLAYDRNKYDITDTESILFRIDFDDLELARNVADKLVNDYLIIVWDNEDLTECY